MTVRRRRSPLPARPRVAIVGANFAGLRAAQGLGTGFDVTVFDPSPWFQWLPNIHELVSRAKRPADLRLPRKRLVAAAGHRFVRDAVVAIDAKRATLSTAAGAVHEFDYCIVAVGGISETYGVRGVERHALPFRSVEQCDAIGRRLAALLKGRTPRSIVIVGGGFTGVEALGEILRRYRSRANLKLHLVEAGSRLMSGASARIDAAVREHVQPYDVLIHTGSRVAAITPAGVRLQSGERLRSDLTIWTGGGVAPALLHAAKLAPKPRQWAPVDATLRSRRYRNVFVIGDAAALPKPVPKQAFHALEMGECAAANIRRAAAGRALRPYRPSRTPLLVAFGDLDTFLVAGRSVVASPALAAGKEAVYQVTMAQIDPPSSVQALGQLASRVIGVTRRLAPPK
jgi:NADH dehydrogenase FAD-containing subunit